MTEQAKSAFSPGPWRSAASPSSVVGWPVVAQTGRPIANVAHVPKTMPGADAFNAESAANATLIAAAPKLYGALVELVHHAVDCEDVPALALAQAADALAEAGGR